MLSPRTDRARSILVTVVALGLALRLWLTFSTFGTDDIRYKALWAELATRYGMPHAYAHSVYLNHPLLGLSEMMLVRRLAEVTGVPFGDVFRCVQTAADLLSFACLLVLGRRTGLGDWPAVFFFLAPPAVLISGFHGNTDPTMVALTLLAAVLVTRHPALAGVVLAAATAVKVIPLLLVPLLFLVARRGRWRFAITWIASIAILFGGPTLIGGAVVLRNTLLYRGLGNWWGIVSMLVMAGRGSMWLPRAISVLQTIDPFVVVGFVLVIAALLWRALGDTPDDGRDLRLLLVACGMVMLLLLVAGTGFGVQYLLWPIPFLPFLTRAPLCAAVTAAISVFLVAVYTHWSGGFPWWFANSVRPDATTDAMVVGGWLVWVTLVLTGCSGARILIRSARYRFASGSGRFERNGR